MLYVLIVKFLLELLFSFEAFEVFLSILFIKLVFFL